MVERKCPSLNLSNLEGILEKVWFYLSLSVDLGYQTKNVNLNPKSTQRDIVGNRFCYWVGIKLSGLAPLQAYKSLS